MSAPLLDPTALGLVVATAEGFSVLAVAAVAFRFYGRSIVKAGFGADDWLILFALACFLSQMGLEIAIFTIVQPVTEPTDPRYTLFLKGVYMSAIPYYPAVAATNYSILFLYRRIFSTPVFKKITMGFIILTTLWLIPAEIVEIFSCRPMAFFWNPTLEGSCIYYSTFWFTVMFIELLMDIAIIALPFLEIRKLKLDFKRKLALAFVFLTGGFVCISGTLRLAFSYEPDQVFPNLINDCLWLNIHLGVAIICACLPTMRPLMVKASEMYSSIASTVGYGSKGSKNSYDSYEFSKRSGGSKRSAPYDKMDDSHSDRAPFASSTTQGSRADNEEWENNFPKGGVHVKTTAEVV